jgi:hypothetical protein
MLNGKAYTKSYIPPDILNVEYRAHDGKQRKEVGVNMGADPGSMSISR